MTFENVVPPTYPPCMLLLTFCSNCLGDSVISFAASLFSGSSGFGSLNKNVSQYTHDETESTGFQSSRRMFRHTFPSWSKFG